MPGAMSEDLNRLMRWEGAGGTWRVAGRAGDSVTVSLCRCDGGEEADRFTSSARDLLGYLADRESSEG
jgi:hypothetical protein